MSSLVGLPVLCCSFPLPFWEFLNPILSFKCQKYQRRNFPKKKDLSLGKRRKSHHRKVLSLSLQDPSLRFYVPRQMMILWVLWYVCIVSVYLCLVLSFSEITLKFWKWTMFLKYQLCLRNLSRRRKFPCQFQSLRKPLLLEVGFVSCLWQKPWSQWILFPTWCLLVLTPCLSLDRISVCMYLWYVTCFPLC